MKQKTRYGQRNGQIWEGFTMKVTLNLNNTTKIDNIFKIRKYFVKYFFD